MKTEATAAGRNAVPVNPQKLRSGLDRIWHAAGNSIAGLKAGWHEPAFRQEALAAAMLLPLGFWVGRSWVEVALLSGSVMLVMAIVMAAILART